MRLPDVAKRLRELSAEHGIAELDYLADQIARRPSTRSPSTSARMSAGLVGAIRSYAELNPKASQAAIAAALNVNQGRVSEVLHGKRS